MQTSRVWASLDSSYTIHLNSETGSCPSKVIQGASLLSKWLAMVLSLQRMARQLLPIQLLWVATSPLLDDLSYTLAVGRLPRPCTGSNQLCNIHHSCLPLLVLQTIQDHVQ